MSDVSVTASAVVKSATAKTEMGIAGATITAGQVVYKDTSDNNKFKLADNNGSALVRAPRGIALNGCSAGQPITVLYEGDCTFNAGFTAGVTYYLSATPGGICPVADLASPTGQYQTVLGMARSTTSFRVGIVESGVASA